MENHRLTWIIRTFDHDDCLEQFWFKNGFGQRCADAITSIEYESVNGNVFVKKANQTDLIDIKQLHIMHTNYYSQSPIFMPFSHSDGYEELKKWFNHRHHHLWIAYIDTKAVGYMRIEEQGESYISSMKDIISVTSAFVDPTEQGKGIGKKLLSEVHRYLSFQDYSALGVDYETINPSGRRFWEKHFTPYTKTLTRRLNEFILED